MHSASHIKWFYGITGGFLLALLVGIATENYAVALIPAVVAVLWAAFFRTGDLVLFTALSAPLSLNLEQLELGGVGFYLPTEPLLFGLTLVFLFKAISSKQAIDPALYKNPITRLVMVHLAWIFLTSICSELPLVSFKFALARTWFVIPCFLMAAQVFKDPKRSSRFFLLYLIPLTVVILYTVYRHSTFGFEKDAGHWVMEPFFKDHTSYGAVLAMFVPVLFGMLVQKGTNNLLRVILMLLFLILMLGVILSYTRAAWVSLVVALGVLGLLWLRVKFRTVLSAAVVVGALVWFAQDDLLIMLERNKQDSSDNLSEHVESISNVSSDASNLERLKQMELRLCVVCRPPYYRLGAWHLPICVCTVSAFERPYYYFYQ